MKEKVIHILTEFTEVRADEMTLSSGLTADLGLSSLDVIEVVLAFEEEFDIEIPDDVIRELATVGDIVDYLEGHVQGMREGSGG